MAGEWPQVQLKDVVSKLGDGLHGTPSYDDDGEYFFINGNNLEDGRIVIRENTRRVSRNESLKHQKMLNNRTILVSINGTLGNVAYYENEKVVLGKSACYLNIKENTNINFIRYVVSDSKFRNYIEQQATGTTIKNVSLKTMREFPFLLPPISEQRAIAHILGTLDDKIELNRRRNETLEAMARALFQDWFVDFGPVRAKMEGREPYLPADIWQLFPDRLDDEGKPEGWETKRVSDFLTLAYGKSLPAEKRIHGTIPVYGSGGITGFHDNALISGPAIIVGRKGTVGSLYWDNRPSFPIDTVFYVQPVAPLSFCYYLLKSLPLRDMNTDAAVPGLNRENVYRLEVFEPPSVLICKFSDTADRLRENVAAISRERATLSQLRDTLLHKLISGELRIKDVSAFLERTPSQDKNQNTRSVS